MERLENRGKSYCLINKIKAYTLHRSQTKNNIALLKGIGLNAHRAEFIRSDIGRKFAARTYQIITTPAEKLKNNLNSRK